MPKISGGILCWRRKPELEVLLVHPGGPFFTNKDEGVWSVPKGELEPGESPIDAALREFVEETSFPAPPRETLVPLGSVTQKSGKVVEVWAADWDVDPTTLVPGLFSMEWPRGSGRIQEFPEVDRAEWMTPSQAARKLNPAQVSFLARLVPGPAPSTG
jgi:predicted NUDIX family NTP pyrophosphohydrolase